VRRAQSVKDYLVSEDVDGSIIDVSGQGESNPIASNATREGRAQNRRVDINVGVTAPME
jgi:OOP family OmpA-OmpF porin